MALRPQGITWRVQKLTAIGNTPTCTDQGTCKSRSRNLGVGQQFQSWSGIAAAPLPCCPAARRRSSSRCHNRICRCSGVSAGGKSGLKAPEAVMSVGRAIIF